MENTILVLNDGENWRNVSESYIFQNCILILTDRGFSDVYNGVPAKHIDDKDILKTIEITPTLVKKILGEIA